MKDVILSADSSSSSLRIRRFLKAVFLYSVYPSFFSHLSASIFKVNRVLVDAQSYCTGVSQNMMVWISRVSWVYENIEVRS